MTMPQRASRTSARHGFTLAELLVVASILAILIALLLPSLAQARWTVRHATCKTNLRQQAVALSTYAVDNWGWYPHPNDLMREKNGTAYHLRPIQRVHNGFVGAVGDLVYPYLPAQKETIAQIDRYRSKAKLAAMNHPTMRCPEAEHLFRYWRKEIPGGGLTNFENNQSYNFYTNCSSGIDSGTVRLTPGFTSFAPTDPTKMLRKVNDTLVMRTNDGPREYTILSSDFHQVAGGKVNTWHGRTEYSVRPVYYNAFYFYNGQIVPNFVFADGSVREFNYHTADRNLMHVSKNTQGISGDGYMLPKEWSQ
jgi:prepilin-type N-terminal cleavage/methylation domain-containing protein